LLAIVGRRPRTIFWGLVSLTGSVAFLIQGYLGRRVRANGAEKLVVILLSHNRPWNLEPIVRVLLSLDFVEKIVVHNSHPTLRVRDFVHISNSRLELVDQSRPTKCGIRFELARNAGGQYYLLIDDDIFLSASQVAQLFESYLKVPNAPGAIGGAIFASETKDLDAIKVTGPSDWPFRRPGPLDEWVDIINGVFIFNDRHLRRYFSLCESLGILDQSKFGNGEDIVLSHTSNLRPRLHRIGFVKRCLSSSLPGIAISSTRKDFYKERWAIFHPLHHREWDS